MGGSCYFQPPASFASLKPVRVEHTCAQFPSSDGRSRLDWAQRLLLITANLLLVFPASKPVRVRILVPNTSRRQESRETTSFTAPAHLLPIERGKLCVAVIVLLRGVRLCFASDKLAALFVKPHMPD
jgi:hypothetical protein